eukprot:scaffold281129_cov40-Tisochrysis_lutea.AAC.4
MYHGLVQVLFGIKGERWEDKGAGAPKVHRLEHQAGGYWIFPLSADTPRGVVVSRTQGAQYFASSRREILSECPVTVGVSNSSSAVDRTNRARARKRRDDASVKVEFLETDYSY